jgi:hypothetical protein
MLQGGTTMCENVVLYRCEDCGALLCDEHATESDGSAWPRKKEEPVGMDYKIATLRAHGVRVENGLAVVPRGSSILPRSLPNGATVTVERAYQWAIGNR